MTDEYGIDLPTENEENLRTLSIGGSIIAERRICELSELVDSFTSFADELLRAGLGVTELLSFFSEQISFGGTSRHADAMPENVPLINCMESLTDSLDKAVFAELLTDRLSKAGVDISEHSFLPKTKIGERFAYVKNAFSDEAYDVFSQDFSDPRLKYSVGFKDAVRSVLDGEVSYALLPLEEAGGTRLPSVAELIYRNDLKINAVTPVFGPDGTAELKYALVSTSLTPPDINKEDDRYLEIRLSGASENTLTALMLAARMYGAEVYRINTVSFKREGRDDSFFSIVLRGEGYDFTRLFVYLTLFTNDFLPVGMYKNLE